MSIVFSAILGLGPLTKSRATRSVATISHIPWPAGIRLYDQALDLPVKMSRHVIGNDVILDEIHARQGYCEPVENARSALRSFSISQYNDNDNEDWYKEEFRWGLHRNSRVTRFLEYASAAAMDLEELEQVVIERNLTTTLACSTRQQGFQQDKWIEYDINNLIKARDTLKDVKKDFAVKKEFLERNIGAFDGQYDKMLKETLDSTQDEA